MKPDITNYEIWLVDYLDGNLDSEQEKLVLAFLEANPDIKEEYEGLSGIMPSPSEQYFVNRNSLKKSADELSDTQFDLLCVALHENDLTPEQNEELNEIIAGNEERSKNAELISKIKLIPPAHTFRFKRRLKKLTLANKVFRISAIGISAAASVLLMFTILRNPGNDTPLAVTDNRQQETGIKDKRETVNAIQPEINVPVKKEEVNLPVSGTHLAMINEPRSSSMQSLNENNMPADIPVPDKEILKTNISKIGGINDILQDNAPVNASLIAMNLIPAEPYDDEEGKAVGNFFTRIIREKILRAETPEKGTLKAYEVADAGITGINKLFGSNITLMKTIDDKGEVKSVYFNSKLIKFNAPVKKAEPLE